MPSRIVFPGPGEVVLQSFELPGIGPRELCARTRYSLMSIGTETAMLHQRYEPDSHFARMFGFPQLKTGVLAVGCVERVGREVSEFAAGDTVYLRQAHGSHQVVRAEACSPVPAGVDLQTACWAGLAKTAFRAAWAAPFRLGEQVLIIGAGPVGQMAVRWAGIAGCADILVSDLSEFRLGHAQRGGATRILAGEVSAHAEVIGDMDGGQGPRVVVDTTGNAAVLRDALAVTARYGKVMLLGDTGYPGRQCLTSDVMMKGLTIQATHDSHDRDGWTQRRVDRLFFQCLQDGRFDTSGLVTHTFAPRDCEAAYGLADRERGQTLGILFDWEA